MFQSLEQNFLIVYHDFGGYDLCWKYCATENPDATDTSFVFYFLAHVICNDLIWLEISPVYVPHPLCFCLTDFPLIAMRQRSKCIKLLAELTST